MTFVSKDEKFVPYFQITGPETIAVTAISSTPLQPYRASKISLPLFVDPENSRIPFVSHDLAPKYDVRIVNLTSNHAILFAGYRRGARARCSSFRQRDRYQ
jgi:hypothetical protein